MSQTGLFLLILAIIAIAKAQTDCDATMCSNVCKKEARGDGTCNGNSCDCLYSKKCSELWYMSCELACKGFNMDGGCNENDQCICKAELNPCPAWHCMEQCVQDPRAWECEFTEASIGAVQPVACLEYGPIQTCGCLCTYLVANSNQTLVKGGHHNSTFNYFLPSQVYAEK